MFFFTNPVWFFSIIVRLLIRFSMNILFRVYFTSNPWEFVGLDGLEPSTSRLSGARSNHLRAAGRLLSGIALRVFGSLILLHRTGGDDGIRTLDPLLAGQVLSQLSYTPIGVSLRSVPEIEQQAKSDASVLASFSRILLFVPKLPKRTVFESVSTFSIERR